MASIHWIRRGKVVWVEQHGGIGSAKGGAKANFDKHRKEIGIERAEVRDDDGVVRMRMPRQIRR